MIDLDEELAQRHLAGCREHLAAMETDLLAARKGDAEFDEDRAGRLLLAVRSVGVGAEFFDLVKLRQLAQHIEDALAKVFSGRGALTQNQAGVLLRAAARMQGLIPDPAASNQADIAGILQDLVAAEEERVSSEQHRASVAERRRAAPSPADPPGG